MKFQSIVLSALTVLSGTSAFAQAKPSKEPADFSKTYQIVQVEKCDGGMGAGLILDPADAWIMDLTKIGEEEAVTKVIMAQDWTDGKRKNNYVLQVSHARFGSSMIMTNLILKDELGKVISKAQLVADAKSEYALASSGNIFCPSSSEGEITVHVVQKQNKK